MTDYNDQQRLKIFLDHFSCAIFEMDTSGKILEINPAGLILFEVDEKKSVLQKNYIDLLKPTDKSRVEKYFAQAVSGQTSQFEFFRQGALNLSAQLLTFTPLFDNNKKIERVIAMSHDLSPLKKTEQMLFNAQKKYRSVIDNIPDLLMEVDQSGHILFINRVLPGYSLDKVIGTHVTDYMQDEDQKKSFAETLDLVKKTSQSQEYETKLILPDGRATVWSSRLTPMYENNVLKRLILLSRDITEKKRIEKEKQQIMEQLFQSQKLESLGKLAGGVAHEFNNLLAIILLHCTMLGNSVRKDSEDEKTLKIIVKSAERAEELTTQLLGFARKGKYGSKPVAINTIIREATNLLKTSFNQNSKITLKQDLQNNLPMILASESQILQCFVNLGLNAIDAMPDGGHIHISSFLKTEAATETSSLQSFVCVEIRDTGEGIAKENLQKIFDPFFTTKDIGKGTGLGLSMVYGIMENHGGKICVTSEPGQGATFTLFFPALQGENNYEKTKNSRRRR